MSLDQSQSVEAMKEGQAIKYSEQKSQILSKFRRKRAKLIVQDHRHKNQITLQENPSQGFLVIKQQSQKLQKFSNQQPPKEAQIKQLKNHKAQKLPKKKPFQQCQICYADFETSKLLSISNCKHKYCSSCLMGHLKAQINMHRVALCPDKDCKQKIDAFSPFLKRLTHKEQQKYYNIQVYNALSNSQTIKICPTQDCEGFINIEQQPIICPICVIQFCQKCLFPKHQGLCDDNAGQYLEDCYNFRKCQKCKMVLEKNKGCHHMTCKCGHQFCYLCGKAWANNHKCNQPKKKTNKYQIPSTLPPSSISDAPLRRMQTNIIMKNQQPNSPINIQIPNNNIISRSQKQQRNIQIQQRGTSCLMAGFKKAIAFLLICVFVSTVYFPIYFILFLISRFLSGCVQFATYSWKLKLFLNVFLYMYCFVTRIPYDCKHKKQCLGVFHDCLVNRIGTIIKRIIQ